MEKTKSHSNGPMELHLRNDVESTGTHSTLPKSGVLITEGTKNLKITPSKSFSNLNDSYGSRKTSSCGPDQIQIIKFPRSEMMMLRPHKLEPIRVRDKIVGSKSTVSTISTWSSGQLSPCLNSSGGGGNFTSCPEANKATKQPEHRSFNHKTLQTQSGCYLDTSHLRSPYEFTDDSSDGSSKSRDIQNGITEEKAGKSYESHDIEMYGHRTKDSLFKHNLRQHCSKAPFHHDRIQHDRNDKISINHPLTMDESSKKSNTIYDETLILKRRNSRSKPIYVGTLHEMENVDTSQEQVQERSPQDWNTIEKEAGLTLPKIRLVAKRPYQQSRTVSRSSLVPQRKLPFVSRLEILEGRFFSRVSHAQSLHTRYEVYPETTETNLPEATLSTAGSVSSHPSSCRSRRSNMMAEKPLVKFRRVVKMVLILLKATYNNREGGHRRERYLSLWASVLNGKFSSSRRAYEMYGISFDPDEFKANTEVQVSTEAKAILSLEPGQRTQQQLRQALASLRQAVEEFSEFPITMQESLARVGRYEHFEAKRVIIRQGHLAENFYFILSGTAVVIILDTDKQTGEQTARTVTFLGKGKSFGELALMYKSRRTATVRCQEDVELLAVAREDFVDIFMHVERDVEPEHVTFLRSLHVLRSWPVEVLPANNPRILVYTYVRRGIVLCKDSNTSEWIYVIKSGSCRVIKALKHVHARKKVHETTQTDRERERKERHASSQPMFHHSVPSLPVIPPISRSPPAWGRRRACKKFRLTLGLDLPAEKLEQVSTEHYRILDSVHRLRHRLSFSGTEVESSQNTSRSNSLDSESEETVMNAKRDGDSQATATVFVDLLSLLPGDIYGLESCVFRSMGNRTTSTSLVSGGAEVIMINRKFFLDHTSEQLRKRLRREIRPLPSEETLQSQLETKISWEAFRHHTLKQTLQLRRKNTSFAVAT